MDAFGRGDPAAAENPLAGIDHAGLPGRDARLRDGKQDARMPAFGQDARRHRRHGRTDLDRRVDSAGGDFTTKPINVGQADFAGQKRLAGPDHDLLGLGHQLHHIEWLGKPADIEAAALADGVADDAVVPAEHGS